MVYKVYITKKLTPISLQRRTLSDPDFEEGQDPENCESRCRSSIFRVLLALFTSGVPVPDPGNYESRLSIFDPYASSCSFFPPGLTVQDPGNGGVFIDEGGVKATGIIIISESFLC